MRQLTRQYRELNCNVKFVQQNLFKACT
jgi:hypothetical protein